VADKVQLEIEIAPDGTVRIETKGLKGESCLAETDSLEKALGEVKSRAKTAEYYAGGAAARARTGAGSIRRR
jgi:hypothetical protein